MKGFSSVGMTYDKFITESQNNASISRKIMLVYLILLFNEITQIFFKSYKNKISVKYTEGFDEDINPGHREHTENIYCQIEGEMDLMVTTHYTITEKLSLSYKKEY